MSMLARAAPLFVTAALLLAVATARTASVAPPQPLTTLDLERYLGRWYVIAQLPADDEVASYFEYRRRDDGLIEGHHVTRARLDGEPTTDRHVARPDPARPAQWTVRENWFSSQDRLVLYVSADYRHALVGDPERESLWLLAREPVIPEWAYAGLLARGAMHGYDVAHVRRVPQVK